MKKLLPVFLAILGFAVFFIAPFPPHNALSYVPLAFAATCVGTALILMIANLKDKMQEGAQKTRS